MKITILTDKNSWMNTYNKLLVNELKSCNHNVRLIHNKKQIEKGDCAFLLSVLEYVPKDILQLNKHNIVVHASDLPNGRGWSPASWQIIEGKNDIPITLFEANEKLDEGNWFIKDILHLDGTELISQWQQKLGQKIISMCLDFINNLKYIKPHKQIGTATYYPKRTPFDSRLDINKSIQEQFNLLRTVDNENYPAYFEINGNKYIIKIEKQEEIQPKMS